MMKTDAVMCIELTNIRPSEMLLSAMHTRTAEVMFMKAMCSGILTVNSLR